MFKFKNVVYTFPTAIGEDCITEMRLQTTTDDNNKERHSVTLVDHWGRERDRRHYETFHQCKRASKALFRYLVNTTP